MSARKTRAPDGAGGQLSRQQRRQAARQSRKAAKNSSGITAAASYADTADQALDRQTLALAANKVQSGAFEDAERLVNEVLARNPRHPEALATKGNIAFLVGNYPIAAELYTNSIACDDRDLNVHFNLGVALEKLHRHAQAAECFERVMERNANYPGCRMGLAIARTAQWRFEEATRLVEEALSYPGDQAEIYATLGGASLGTGDARKALFHYAETLKLKPESVHLHDTMRMPAALTAFAPGPDQSDVWKNTLTELREVLPGSPVPSILDSFVRSRLSNSGSNALAPVQASLPELEEQTVQLSGSSKISQGRCNTVPPTRMCALLHFGRSATGLLHALIDGHPQVTTLPGVYFKGFFGYGLWERIRNADADVMIDRFIDLYEVLFDARSPKPVPGNPTALEVALGVQEGFVHMGENADQWLSLDKTAFRTHMREQLSAHESISQGEFFAMLHRAFERAQGKSGNEELIFYHIHNPAQYEFANFLRSFPDAQLVMMVREPLQNSESWISGQVLKTNDYFAMASRVGSMPFDMSQPEFQGRDAFGVKLDDLKLRPEATMRALAERLGIDWSPCLLEPTMQDLKWRGDPTSATFDLDPFDPGVLKREIGKIFGERDQKLFRAVYFPFRVLYGWEDADDRTFMALLADALETLDQPLDCEKLLVETAGLPLNGLRRHGLYRYLRCLFGQRLETLKKYGTYPGMIQPLIVED